MSIPRLAIHRPVTMFMICSIVVLLGLISLTRLPVDLLPDVSQPTINVNVINASICTCWTSLVVRVISEGGPKCAISRAE